MLDRCRWALRAWPVLLVLGAGPSARAEAGEVRGLCVGLLWGRYYPNSPDIHGAAPGWGGGAVVGYSFNRCFGLDLEASSYQPDVPARFLTAEHNWPLALTPVTLSARIGRGGHLLSIYALAGGGYYFADFSHGFVEEHASAFGVQAGVLLKILVFDLQVRDVEVTERLLNRDLRLDGISVSLGLRLGAL